MKDKLFKKLSKIKDFCKDKLLAIYDNDPSVAKTKQIRLGFLVVVAAISVLYLFFI